MYDLSGLMKIFRLVAEEYDGNVLTELMNKGGGKR